MTTEEQFEDRIDFSILRPQSYLYPFTMEDLPEEENDGRKDDNPNCSE
jgi:hypothetical protein